MISPATPAAALVWPMLALTEPIAAGGASTGGLASGATQRAELGRVAHTRAGAVPFEVGDCLDPESRSLISPAQGQELPLDLGARQPPLAVRREPPAADHRDHPSTLRQRIRQTHQHHHATAFTGPEAGRSSVVDPHRISSQGPGLGEAHELERVEAQINAAGQRDIEIPAASAEQAWSTASRDEAQAPSTV